MTDLQRSQLGLMYSAAFGLASIASDVMDLAREEKDLTAGGAELFSLVEPLRQVERMVRPIVEEKGLELRVVGPDRWQGRGHPHALSRVLLNLTTNALKFTDEGTVELGVKPLLTAAWSTTCRTRDGASRRSSRRCSFSPFGDERRSPKKDTTSLEVG